MMFINTVYLKSTFFILCLSLIIVGCTGSDDNGGGSSPAAFTCADDVQVCSPPYLAALYGGGVFYFNEAAEINLPIKIHEGGKQTFYAIIYDADILSGESINVDINSRTVNLNTNIAGSLNDYFSSAIKMVPENVPSALENYTNADGYEIFIFTFGESIALDDRVVGEHEISVVPFDAKGLEGSTDLFKMVVVIENVIDLPVIRSRSASGGMLQDAQNNGTYRIQQDVSGAGISIVVTDDDFAMPQNQESLHIAIMGSTLPEGFITIQQQNINRPDSSTNNRATFRIEFASPTNELVGTHNVTFSIADLSGNTELVPIKIVIENVNDAPVISTLTTSGGVRARNGNIFEVFEGGNDGTIRVVVDDADIQHGDIVGLNITGSNSLAKFISIDRDKLPQSDATNNQVEFIVHIASDLLQDTNKGEYPLDFLVYDEFGGAKDIRSVTLKVKNTDDASSVSNSAINGGVSKLSSVDGTPDIFAISEGQSGQIEITILDEDLTPNSQLEYAITGDAEVRKILRAYRIKRSLPRGERKVTIGIAERQEQFDDVHVGSYNLSLHVVDDEGIIGVSYPFVLKVNNVGEELKIVEISPQKGLIYDYFSGLYKLQEDVASSLNIVVEDEDLENPQNQESISFTTMSYTIPKGFITVQQSEISHPDSSTKNRATFRIEFAAPTDELVGKHNVTFSFADTTGNTILYEMEMEIRNVNDAPEIFIMDSAGGVISNGENIFEVYEGGENGTIRVVVEDGDIQHGDVVGLNITSANLPAGIISIEKDKLSQSDATNNRVEFVLNIASGLLRDADIGEHLLNFLVYDEFGGAEDIRTITLRVKNIDDASTARYAETSGGVNKLQSVDGIPDTFEISEGQSGQIEVVISDEDLIHTSQLKYTITDDIVRTGLLNVTRVESSSSAEEHIFLIDIGKNGSPIDDADIGSYNLNLRVADDDRAVNANYLFVLKVNNVIEQPNIIDVLAGTGVSTTENDNSWKLSEDVAGSLSVVVEDEDFGSSHNQERLHITIMSSTLPENFITVQQSEISRPDSSTNNRVTFSIKFASPTNQLVGEHNITFSFTDTDGNTALYEGEFRIENVNDAPVISAITSLGGVVSVGGNVFEVFEGGDNGAIKVVVDDADIQHGDIIGLNITGANLPAGVISIEKDKLSQSAATNNQVEFIVHIASELLQDTDTGEYPLDFSVYDELGGAEDRRTITLKVINSDDASTANYLGVSGMVNKLQSVDGIPDTFEISEGQSGQIKVAISDEDLIRASRLEYTITGNSIREGLLDITKVELSSSAEEQIFLIDVGKNGSPIDDADIGSYNLNLRVTDALGTVNANYHFVLNVNNVVEQPNIIDVLAGTGVSAATNDNSWTLSEDVAGSLSIVVEDEDFGSLQNQERINITIMSPTLPENFIAVQQSEISRPDSSTNNRVTFRIEFAGPTNQLVGEHNITFSFTDTAGNTALYKREFKIENVNDAPAISAITSLDGVISVGRNIFEVFEGGDNGAIKVVVNDVDIQHGDIVSLNIISADLPGIISIEEDKLSQSDATNNQVEFVLNVASGLLQDADIGEHQFRFLVYDESGGIDGSGSFTLNVKNTDDTSSINYFRINGDINKLSNVDGAPDTYAISEGQSGQIEVVISDEDLIHPSQLEYTITGNSIGQGVRQGIRAGLLNITKVEPLSSSEEHTFFIDIGKNGSPIDDADIGSYNLDLHIFDVSADRRADALYPFVLEINNLPEPTAIINVQAGQGAVAGTGTNYFVLTEKVSASIDIIVMDEDLVNPLAQENITMEIISSDLPNDLLLAKSLYISRPDTVGGNQATFVLEIAAPRNEDARDDNYTIPFIVSGADGRSLLDEISIRIENVNDVPVMSPLTHSGGVGRTGLPVEKNTFIVSEGGVNGAITVTVEDPDIQHGDIVGLEISNNALLGDSAFIDKYFSVESSIAGTNQVEFTIHIASELMQDTDIGEHHFQLTVYDSFGGSATRDFIVIVEDTNDLTTISNFGWTGNLTKIAPVSSPVPSNGRDLFTIYEGQSGQIEFTLSDEDLALAPLIVSNITGDPIDSRIISSAIITKPSSPDERILTINIGNGTEQIDDAHIGTYELSLNISSSAGEVEMNYPFTLQIINVEEQPRIIKILPSFGFTSGPAANSFILTQDVATSFIIMVEDEDFARPQNQENITITFSHPTDPNHPFLTLISYKSPLINMPDTTGGKSAILVAKIAAPSNNFVGEHTLSITAIDSSARTANLDLNLTLLNVNDAPRIINITSSGSVRRNDMDNFVVAEGASPNGAINVIVEDIDFILRDSVSLDVASATLDAKFLSIAKTHTDESDANSNHQVIFNIDIPSESLNDAEVGTHILEISATDTEGVIATRQVNLVVENVNDAPEIVSITHTEEISKTLLGGEDYIYELNEGSSGFLYIKIVDEDLIHSHESITVSWKNPLSDELLSFDKQFFTSADALEGGVVNLVLRLGQGADFDDVHINGYAIDLSIFDSTGEKVDAIESSILLEIINVQERPFFPVDTHTVAVFERSGAAELPAGTVIATIGQPYCSGLSSISGCGSPPPVIIADDPDYGDAARLSYALQTVDTEYFYLDGLKIKNRIPIRVGTRAGVIIHVVDPNYNRELIEGYIVVHVKSSNNPNQDYDGDGVRDPYDGDPANRAIQTVGSGTSVDPYLIHNIYQLQAIAGVDHLGNTLQTSEFTSNSYLYGNGLVEQLSSHYRLANDISASLTSTWNRGSGFTPIGAGACNGGSQQCDASTTARRVSGSPARFSGTFDGANFEVSGLTIKRQSSYIGLFGEAGDGSIISNLRLTAANIINSATRTSPSHGVRFSHGGVLVGQMLGGAIDNVHTTGTLTGVGYRYGGVAGTLGPSASLGIPGTITDSMADVDITANGAAFGGLVGLLGGNSFIHASNAKGNVRSALNSINQLLTSEIGGLVGNSYGNIFASYATGDVRGLHYVGGLVGIVKDGATTASFAAGDVQGIRYVGGLFGEVSRGTHRYLYYSGMLIGSGHIKGDMGGIVGKLDPGGTIYSVINMRSPHPGTKRSDGGLIFGHIDLVNKPSPNIHDAYSIDFHADSLGYITHSSYLGGRGAPLSLLGSNSGSIRKVSSDHFKYCRGNGETFTIVSSVANCTGLFNNNYWGDLPLISLGSSFNVVWNLFISTYPTIKVQRFTDRGATDRTFSFPSHEEQICHIQPEYTHRIHCPTTNR